MTLYRTGDGKMYTVSDEGNMKVSGKEYKVEYFVPGNIGVSNRDGIVYFGGAALYDKTGKINSKLDKKAERRARIIGQILNEDGTMKKSNKLENLLVTEQIIDIRK